ncbi:thiamine transporter 2-like isoform X2 [Ascaphus truei]|uniref:thiamine transporter 2-like isoform X2 n=1 Tax=Ascaphus truei TaxID=8439 RepID=UPI003F59E5AB
MNILKTFQSYPWLYPMFLLCTYGFFFNMRPAEPFYTPYMIGPYKNFTTEQVMNQLSPIWTYSLLALTLPVFLLTDMFRYKPTLIVQGLCLVIGYSLLCFAQGIPAMQYVQFTFAMVTAAEVAYYSYMYSMVTVDMYQKVTSYCRGITLAGYTTGAMLGQLLVSVGHISYFYLNVITLGFAVMASIISVTLPMPSKTLFLYKDYSKDLVQQGTMNWVHVTVHVLGKLFHQLWLDFKECYSSKMLMYWSLWWALVTCGYYQVFNYTQMLWNNVEPSHGSVFNGGIEALAALLGSLASFMLDSVRLDWGVWGELALSLFSGISSAALFVMMQIAVNLTTDRYALVFGTNNFVALVLQTILTAILVDSRGLDLDIHTQFLIYGSYFSVISGLFLIRGIYTVCNPMKNKNLSDPQEMTRH